LPVFKFLNNIFTPKRLPDAEVMYLQSEEGKVKFLISTHTNTHMHIRTQDQEVLSVREQLEQSENMRRRLNDQVTELQGQLAIEEQRSRFCVLL